MASRKKCATCQTLLPDSAFNHSSATSDGLARTCRVCVNSKRRQRTRTKGNGPRSVPAKVALALREGNVSQLRRLLCNGIDPDWSWICETMRSGHLVLAELLLQFGVEKNIFTMAAMGDMTGLKRRLAQHPEDALSATDMNPACHRITALHVACATDWRSLGPDRLMNQLRVAQLLFQKDADINATAVYRGISDVTPLLCACWTSRNLKLVQWLVEHAALPSGRELMAALGHFQRHGKEAYDIAEYLLSIDQPVDGDAPGERTPLQAFAFQGTRRTVAWLLAHGADVNARGPGSWTAAHFAAQRNTTPKTLELLVEHGADLTVRNADSHTPLDIAKLNGKSDLIDWLKSHSSHSARGSGRHRRARRRSAE